ncbi:MAG TPA: ATP-dependent Clp protease ATP-binding subunit [Candidatus Saccharimonadales bacterium]
MHPASEFADFLGRLTDNARSSLKHADSIARGLGSPFIGTEHILLGVLAQETSFAAKILEESGVTLNRAKVALNLTPKSLIVNTGSKGLSETAKLTLRMSWEIAQEFNQEFCGTEHILFSIISQKNARATKLLQDMSVDIDSLNTELEGYLNRQQFEFDGTGSSTKSKRRRASALDFFGLDITDKAHKAELDPVVGRDDQIRRVVTILNRRTKNNPVLIGEPGVGKTAIVEGLAQRIVSEEVPDTLLDKRVVVLDLAGMLAGTKYRGEFEERLKRVTKELVSDKNIILFIDEMHLLVGAGAAEGAIDAANILKPSLARGQIQVIGATTMDEYTRYIEKDAALERRFQPVKVPENNLIETTAILRELKKHYEKHHGVTIDDAVVLETIAYAHRYINDRFMPDKAIDLMDEAAALVRVERGKTSKEQRRLKRELKLMGERMEAAGEREDYERAAKYKQKIKQLEKRLEEQQAKSNQRSKLKVTSEDVAQVVATMTGVPVTSIKKSEAKFLTRLEAHLSKFVIGQDDAIKAVSQAIRRNRSGVSDSQRPIGSFVFLGPTGVGKTELARVLARELFLSEEAMIKIDMSEYGERHTVARLIGSPAGYVGYEDSNQLTDRVRRQPYSLVLFDEVEKAHPEIFNVLLQILEDGYLTDAKGRRVDFSNTVIIMTSNIGAEALQREAALGFRANHDGQNLQTLHEENVERVQSELKRMMRPELLNRIDKVIVFKTLGRQTVRRILDLQIDQLNGRLSGRHLLVKVTPSAKKLLAELGYDPKNGVRPLRRVIQDEIEDYLAGALLSEKIGKGDVIKITVKKDKLSFAPVVG